MKHSAFKSSGCLFWAAIWLLTMQSLCFGRSRKNTGTASANYMALPFNNGAGNESNQKITYRYGIPFLEGRLNVPVVGISRIGVGVKARRILILGMTEDANIRAWADSRDYSVRYFLGDKLGEIRLQYTDGSMQTFPLILGESIWWGKPFYRYQYPFPADSDVRKTFAAALRLYPATAVEDGKYLGVISPKPLPIRNIVVENSPAKKGTVVIEGITLQTASGVDVPGVGGTVLVGHAIPTQVRQFIRQKPLLADGAQRAQAEKRLNEFRQNFYSSDKDFRARVRSISSLNYSGPQISFKGDVGAQILTNAFSANVQDMLAKIDSDGMYHTSTRGAISWGGRGFGTYRPDVGMYYSQSWSRDMGRTLQELTCLGYLTPAASTADYTLKMAQLWVERPGLRLDGTAPPPHWGRIANRPDPNTAFENDAQGLISVFLYDLWLRLPNREQWLRARWPGIKAAGDWILWQFDHPQTSGAANGVLHTTGESAGGNGFSVYADTSCMISLRALAKMADSIGERVSAAAWRQRADQMQSAIAAQYIIANPRYGRVWTLKDAGWPDKSTVLGPLILAADYRGYAPQDGILQWHPVDEATYQRLIDTYRPFGFYGQAMGYGQGFVTQSALLLDRMQDATNMLDWTAKQIYDPRAPSFITPEGVQIDPTGRFWYRTGDLGNGVQEAEIIKTLRIVIGVDDTQPNRIQFFPRMPYGWKEMAVEKYPVLFQRRGKINTTLLRYKLVRSGGRMKLEIASDENLGQASFRLGPFEKQPRASDVQINGKSPAESSIEHSGDSWWVGFTMSVGPLAEERSKI